MDKQDKRDTEKAVFYGVVKGCIFIALLVFLLIVLYFVIQLRIAG